MREFSFVMLGVFTVATAMSACAPKATPQKKKYWQNLGEGVRRSRIPGGWLVHDSHTEGASFILIDDISGEW